MGQIERGGLLGGIGLFLFGMSIFESTIQQNGKGWLKHTLKKYTNKLPKSIITGMLQTFVFQSSTIVTMITLGFVGAGLIGLYNALGVVLGANIGSSLTTRLVALVGFNFKIETYTLPIIGLAGLAMIMTQESSIIHKISKTIVGFGLLFLGLGYMKESVESMTNAIDFASYANWSVWGFIAIGAILTTIIQTSTGVTIMTLVALSGGIITLDMGLGVVIGANIGSALSTGIIGFLSAAKSQHTKKQVAVSQIIFNCTTALIVIPLIQPLKHFILTLTTSNENALAMFHTFFNIVLITIWPPILKGYSKHLSKWFVPKGEDHKLNIECVNTKIDEELTGAIHDDTKDLINLIQQYMVKVLGTKGPDLSHDMISLYNKIKSHQTILLSSINRHKPVIVAPSEIQKVNDLTSVILDACAASASLRESLDHCENIAQEKDINGIEYYRSWRDFVHSIIKEINDVPYDLEPAVQQEYHDIITKKIIQRRQEFMELVQQGNISENELISELIKTDHYITSACQELLGAMILWHSIPHKVLEL